LDELRSQTRRKRFERLVGLAHQSPPAGARCGRSRLRGHGGSSTNAGLGATTLGSLYSESRRCCPHGFFRSSSRSPSDGKWSPARRPGPR
jgi:hypothetical protein